MDTRSPPFLQHTCTYACMHTHAYICISILVYTHARIFIHKYINYLLAVTRWQFILFLVFFQVRGWQVDNIIQQTVTDGFDVVISDCIVWLHCGVFMHSYCWPFLHVVLPCYLVLFSHPKEIPKGDYIFIIHYACNLLLVFSVLSRP